MLSVPYIPFRNHHRLIRGAVVKRLRVPLGRRALRVAFRGARRGKRFPCSASQAGTNLGSPGQSQSARFRRNLGSRGGGTGARLPGRALREKVAAWVSQASSLAAGPRCGQAWGEVGNFGYLQELSIFIIDTFHQIL